MVIYTVKGFSLVNKPDIDVFLELSCFFDDPVDVGNLISGFSAFSKSSLNIWKFTVHAVLLKPGLENFEHYFASMWDECSCAVVWTFFGIAFGIWMKTDLFQSCGHYWVFQNYIHVLRGRSFLKPFLFCFASKLTVISSSFMLSTPKFYP